MEQRRLERFKLNLPASLSVTGKAEDMELFTNDVSAGGAYFQVAPPLALGTEVKVELVLPLAELKKVQGQRALIRVSGQVVRASESGMAVCFNQTIEIASLPD